MEQKQFNITKLSCVLNMYKYCHTQYVQVLPYTVCTSIAIHRMYNYCHTQYIQVLPYTICTNIAIHNMYKYCHTHYIQVLPYTVCRSIAIHYMYNYCHTQFQATLLTGSSVIKTTKVWMCGMLFLIEERKCEVKAVSNNIIQYLYDNQLFYARVGL
jgi:hypothetical protein